MKKPRFKLISLSVFTLLLLLISSSYASIITINDPFPGKSGDSTSYDVIGNRKHFDIQHMKFYFDGHTLTKIALSFNYWDSAVDTTNDTITPYSFYGLTTLNLGDLLFSSNGTWKYGIVLASHAGSPNGGPSGINLVKGGLYEIKNPKGTMTARQALNNLDAIYRKDEAVWLHDEKGKNYLSLLETLSIDVSPFGNGTDNAEFLLQISGFSNSNFLSDMTTGMFAQFSVATCANDIISGDVAPVPEPATFLLFGIGMLGVGGLSRKFNKTNHG